MPYSVTSAIGKPPPPGGPLFCAVGDLDGGLQGQVTVWGFLRHVLGVVRVT